MGPKISWRMFSIMHSAKTWKIKISVPQNIPSRRGIENFCYMSGHKRLVGASPFLLLHENGDVLKPLLVQTW